MALTDRERTEPTPSRAISSELAVTVLTLITVVLAVFVYVFAITFL